MRRAIWPAVVGLCACGAEVEYLGAFELPAHGAVTAGDTPGPFDQPLAFVAGRTGGRIWPLALRDGRFLTDDPAVSFLRGAGLSVGSSRSVVSVAAWIPAPDRVDVFVVDGSDGAVWRVPYVTGVGPSGPIEATATVGDPVATGGGTLTSVRAIDGFATTESWVATFDGEAWRLHGERSGALSDAVPPGSETLTSDGSLRLTFGGSPAAGDKVRFGVDTGMVALPDLGPALAVATSPDQRRLAVLTIDPASGATGLAWWDLAAEAVIAEFDLPEGARPARPVFASDGTLWFADHARSGAWTAEADAAPSRIDLPWPTLDVAPSPEAGRLFLAPIDGSELYTYDLAARALVDVNPTSPGVDGVPTSSPITGIASLQGLVHLLEDNDYGVRKRSRVVAVSLARGPMVFLDQQTGCLVSDGGGPRTDFSQSVNRLDYTAAGFTLAPGTTPWLEGNYDNTRSVLASSCTGVTRSEAWTVTFDSARQGWLVEGAVSGVQRGLAYEDRRYVSDRGEISFLLRAGTQSPRAGWQFRFQTLDGVLQATGDQDADGIVDVASAEVSFRLPGDPLAVSWRVPGEDQGWSTVIDRVYAIVPLEGADAVVRVRPEDAQVDAVWQ